MGRKKLTEEEKTARKEKKKTKDVEKTIEKEENEEFPDINLGIDIFSQQTDLGEKKETIKEIKITKKELEERAKKLGEKLVEVKTEDIKEKFELERKTLIPVEEYLESGIYIGTKVITPKMREFVYRRRNDGIAILDINLIDKKLKELIKIICKYNLEDFVIVCKREAGWKAVNKFFEVTGVRVFTKKYPAGIMTNTKLPSFFETEMVFVVDPWIDMNAMNDARITKKKVLALCDTNNYTQGIDFFVPCNNKAGKSIGLILYLIAKEYLKTHGIKAEIKKEDFISEEEEI